MNALSSLRRATMRSPIVWGLLACAAFYGLVHGGPLGFPIVHRYFTHHPVEYGETLLFSIGLADFAVAAGERRDAHARTCRGRRG